MLCFQVQKDFKFNLVLLDDRRFQFVYKGGQKCQQLLNDTVKLFNFNIDEMQYFGFRFIDSNSQAQWINLNKSVQSQFKHINEADKENSNETIVYFNVKYYQPDPCKLNDTTRYLFYLQLRKDILNGRLPVKFDYAVDLFCYFLQSELGDHNSARDTHGYSSEFEFISNQSIELEKAAETKHAKLKSMNQVTAEMNFLNKAKWLEMYGVDLQPAVDEENREYFIGLTPTGISVYQNSVKINSYFWPRISKLNHKGNKFVLTVIENTSEERDHVFVLTNKASCKSLWRCCVDHHRFFRIKTVYEEPALLSTAVVTNKRKSVCESSVKTPITRVKAKRIQRRKFDQDPIIIDVNKINLSEKIENDNLVFKPVENLLHHEGLFGSSGNIAEIPNVKNNGGASPTISQKSVGSYKCPNPPRRESASEGEFGSRRRYGSRNRSRNRRNHGENEQGKKNDSDSDTENVIKRRNDQDYSDKSRRISGRHRNKGHRSASRGSTKTSHPDWSSLMHQKSETKVYKSRKSLVDNSSGVNLVGQDYTAYKIHKQKMYESSCHETSMDENDFNEMEKKRQIRRRKRSKSPGATTKPPEEILQHIKYNLVEQNGLNADQLREIPFVKVETSAAPFRISPHQNKRRYSPGRRKSGDFYDSKTSIAYLSNGTAHIMKTKSKLDDMETGVAVPNVQSKPISMGSAVNTKLNTYVDTAVNNGYSGFKEPAVNIGFSADSGCEDMVIRQN